MSLVHRWSSSDLTNLIGCDDFLEVLDDPSFCVRFLVKVPGSMEEALGSAKPGAGGAGQVEGHRAESQGALSSEWSEPRKTSTVHQGSSSTWSPGPVPNDVSAHPAAAASLF